MLNIQQLKAIFGNEQVLLVLLARLYFSSAQRSSVEEFITAHPINWQLFGQIARAHNISSFIYHTVVVHQLVIDPQLEAQLKKRYQANRLKNFKQIQAAADLLKQFKERGITLIPYKGAIFSQAYYADLAIRESVDLDFLISKDDLTIVEDYFIEKEYLPLSTVPRSYLRYYRTFFKDIVYHKPQDKLGSIELHWRLMDRYAGKFPAYPYFLPHLVKYQANGLSIDKLAPSYDFLAVSSNHFVKDMGIKFKYLIDIACMGKQEQSQLDSAVIYACAKRYGFEKKLTTGLNLVEQLLGVGMLNNVPIVLAAEILITPLAYPIHLPRLYINEPKFIKRSLQLQDNLINQVKFILRCCGYLFLPTYEDINQSKLPVYLLPLFIVMRPFRLVYQWIKPSKSTVNPQ